MAGSPRESPALAAQLRAFSVISSSLRAELSTSRNHSAGKVSAFADVSSDHSHPLTVCQWYCGRRRLLAPPSTSAMSVWERLVHPRSTGLAAREARLATPYWQDRHGLHYAYAPLRPHQTCRRKEVRLRLVSFDARSILYGSVVHFVPDTSSENERRRETATAGVPLLFTPSLTDSQSGIATLALRSICAGPIRSMGFSSSVAAAGFTPTAPSPSVSSPFTAPIPPPTLRHSSPFRRPDSHVRSALPSHLDSNINARAGKTAISRLDHRTVRLLPRLSACLLTLRKTERTMLPHRPFRLPTSRAENVRTLPVQCIVELHLTPEANIRIYMTLSE